MSKGFVCGDNDGDGDDDEDENDDDEFGREGHVLTIVQLFVLSCFV